MHQKSRKNNRKNKYFRIPLPGVLLLCLFLGACAESGENSSPLTTLPPSPDGTAAPTDSAPVSPSGTDSSGDTDISTPFPALPPDVTWKIQREARTDTSGQEVAFAQYPVFTANGQDFQALSSALSGLNEQCRTQCITFLDEAEENAKQYRTDIDPAYVFSQTVSVSLTRCDADIICLVLSKTTEEGGPHPNNDTTSFSLDTRTWETLQLSDVIPVDDALKETIRTQLPIHYPELTFDEALLEQDVWAALTGKTVTWYFWEDQLCISFPEGSFGFGHAEGSLGVLLPWQ